MHLYFPQVRVGRGISKGLDEEELDEVTRRLEDARADVMSAKPRRDDASLLVDEVLWTIDVLELLMDDARARLAAESTLASVPQPQRADLAKRLSALTDEYRRLWLARNRPGGLVDSVGWLDHLREAYETGDPDPTWGGWPKAFT